MITDGKKWHYLAVKNLSALLRGITGNNNGDFYYLNCFRSYTTKNKLEKHKNVCDNYLCIIMYNNCYVKMPREDNEILKYNHSEKSMRAPFVIYVDLECLLEKISACRNKPKKSSATKINKYIPSGYSLFTCSSFDTTKNKFDFYRGENCMNEFCKVFKKHVTRIISCEKKEMIPLTKEVKKVHRRQKKKLYMQKKI